MNIAVLMGGLSGERNVSFTGGKAIFNALVRKGHNVIAIDPALGEDCIIDINKLEIKNEIPTDEELSKFPLKNYIECINSDNFSNIDCVFNLVHGKWGEDGHLQALLDLRGLKYTGSEIRSSALSMDKNQSKMIFMAGGIETAEWDLINTREIDLEHISTIQARLGKNLVVKPYDQGSALGLSILKQATVHDIEEAVKKIAHITKYALIETYIAGRELTVAVIDDKVYPVIEIKPKEGFYDYKNKYTKGQTEYICPADLSEDIADYTKNTALLAADLLGCRDYCRVDFRLNEDNVPFCLEVNTIPGFTELSLLPMAAREGGIEFDDLCELLINLALKH